MNIHEQELAWYFEYAESAHRHGTLALLPPQEASKLSGDTGSHTATRKRALELARAIHATLRSVPAQEAGVLRAIFTYRKWPVAVGRAFGPLASVVVRMECAENPWPERGSHDGLERAAAVRLARHLAAHTAREGKLQKRAAAMRKTALAAYESARLKGAVNAA